ELREMENWEESGLREFLTEKTQESEAARQRVQQVYSDVERFVELNRGLVEVPAMLERGDYVRAYDRLERLEEKHSEIDDKVMEELRELGLPREHLEKIGDTVQRMEAIDEELLERLGSEREAQAREKLERRPTVIFEQEALKKFISSVLEEVSGRGAELPGFFHFEEVEDGFHLLEFYVLENTDPSYASFKLEEQVNRIIEEYGNDRSILLAHSHPFADFTHSSTDKDLVSRANGVGVIAVPSEKGLFVVPEMIEDGRWVNLPAEVARNGERLDDEELEQKFPQVADYNSALEEAVAEGQEFSWPNRV
ncbi:MAG: hypothetical protein ABEJ91_00540, partial [Candidatus Nanohaloarchaea archaeon]